MQLVLYSTIPGWYWCIFWGCHSVLVCPRPSLNHTAECFLKVYTIGIWRCLLFCALLWYVYLFCCSSSSSKTRLFCSHVVLHSVSILSITGILQTFFWIVQILGILIFSSPVLNNLISSVLVYTRLMLSIPELLQIFILHGLLSEKCPFPHSFFRLFILQEP